MNEDQLQAERILARRFLSEDFLARAMASPARGGEADLCELLVRGGYLTLGQAHAVRRDTARAASATRGSLELSGYERLGDLATGGMGEVALARQRSSGKIVALKRLGPGRVGPRLEQRLRREARALAMVEHPNVLRIHELKESEQGPVLVLERVEGADVQRAIDASEGVGLPEEQLRGILAGLVAGLEACHEAGVVHRDIKPANVVIEGREGRVVLIDFGVVGADDPSVLQRLDDEASPLTQSGELLGTPGYIAPELLEPGGEFGAPGRWSDIWGFGGVIYAGLTGRAPYEGVTAINIYRRILEGPPRPARELRSDAPDDLVALCEACLQHDSSARPNAAEIAAALRERRGLARPRGRRSRRSPRLVLAALGAPLILLLALVLASLGATPRLSFVDLGGAVLLPGEGVGEPTLLSRAPSLELELALDAAPLARALWVGSERRALEGGRVRITLEATPKERAVALRLENWLGARVALPGLRVRLDGVAPRLFVDQLPRFAASRLRVAGRVSEPLSSLEFSGSPVPVDGRSFELEWTPARDSWPPVLVAVDLAGNRTRLSMPLRFVDAERGSHTTLKAALRDAPSGLRVLLGPGRFPTPEFLEGRVDLRGSPEGGTVLVSSVDRPTGVGFTLRRASLTGSHLSFEYRSRGGVGVALERSSARLDSCVFTLVGGKVAALVEVGDATSFIDLDGCRMESQGVPGTLLRVASGAAELRDCRLEVLAPLESAARDPVGVSRAALKDAAVPALMVRDAASLRAHGLSLRSGSRAIEIFEARASFEGARVEMRERLGLEVDGGSLSLQGCDLVGGPRRALYAHRQARVYIWDSRFVGARVVDARGLVLVTDDSDLFMRGGQLAGGLGVALFAESSQATLVGVSLTGFGERLAVSRGNARIWLASCALDLGARGGVEALKSGAMRLTECRVTGGNGARVWAEKPGSLFIEGGDLDPRIQLPSLDGGQLVRRDTVAASGAVAGDRLIELSPSGAEGDLSELIEIVRDRATPGKTLVRLAPGRYRANVQLKGDYVLEAAEGAGSVELISDRGFGVAEGRVVFRGLTFLAGDPSSIEALVRVKRGGYLEAEDCRFVGGLGSLLVVTREPGEHPPWVTLRRCALRSGSFERPAVALSGARGWFYELSLERSRESPGSCAFALSSGAQVRFEGLRAAGAWRLGLALEGSYAELSGGIFTAGFELRDSSLLEFTDPPTRGRDRGARRVDVLSRVAEVFERGSPR